MTDIIKTIPIELELEHEEYQIQIDEKTLEDLKALAKLQKATATAELFATIIGNEGKDVPKSNYTEKLIVEIANSLEVIDEED